MNGDDNPWNKLVARGTRIPSRTQTPQSSALIGPWSNLQPSTAGMPSYLQAAAQRNLGAIDQSINRFNFSQRLASGSGFVSGEPGAKSVGDRVGYYGAGGQYLGPLYSPTGDTLPMPKGAVGIKGLAGIRPDTQGGYSAGAVRQAQGQPNLQSMYNLGYSGVPGQGVGRGYLAGYYGPRESGVVSPSTQSSGIGYALGQRVGSSLSGVQQYLARLVRPRDYFATQP